MKTKNSGREVSTIARGISIRPRAWMVAAAMVGYGSIIGCENSAGSIYPVGQQVLRLENYIEKLQQQQARSLQTTSEGTGAGRASVSAAHGAEALGRAHASLIGSSDICILMHAGANQDSFADIAADNHRAYALRHGYSYLRFRGHLDGDGDAFVDPLSGDARCRDGVFWQALVATGWALSAVRPGSAQPLCRWVMTVDGDVLFTTPSVGLHQALAAEGETGRHLLDRPDIDVILAREELGLDRILINAGVTFVKNSPRGFDFLIGTTRRFPEYKERDYHEQDAIQDYALQTDYFAPERGVWSVAQQSLRPEIAVLRQRAMNSFYRFDDVPSTEATIWQQGDFIAHLTATSAADRVARMRQLIDQTRHL